MTVGGVRKMKMYASCPGFPSGGIIRALQSNMLIPPACSSPLMSEDLPGMPRSWCLLSITGLAALAPSEASTTRQLSPGWVIFLQPARRASVLGRFSSFRPHWLGHPPGDYFYCFIVRMIEQIPDIMTYKPNV
jgi:hypothetical protein